jgi:hypothetical protein
MSKRERESSALVDPQKEGEGESARERARARLSQ